MNKQIDVTALKVTMTSREIAELANKRHDHVLRDIDNLVKELSPELGLGYKSTTYIDSTGKRNRQFEMDRDSTYCLVTGYDATSRMRVIKRWQELEAMIDVPDKVLTEDELQVQQAKHLVSLLEFRIEAKNKIKNLELELNILKSTESNQDNKILNIESKIKEFDSETGYRTVLAYARDNNFKLPTKLANQIGRNATKLCKEKNLMIGKVSDERYGYVNSYPISVLDEIFE